MSHGRTVALSLIALFSLCMSPLSTHAQDVEGRWSIGMAGGANLWLNDMNQQKVGFGGEASLRYGLARWFSLGLATGYEVMKAGQSPTVPGFIPYEYVRVNAIPASLVATFNLSPGSTTVPYVYAGVGAMFYQRSALNGIGYPDNKFQTSIHIPVGVGIETFLSSGTSLSFDLGLRVMDDWTENWNGTKSGGSSPDGTPDAYGTVKVGLNFYLGSSLDDDDDADGLTNREEETYGTNPNNPDTDGDGLSDGDEVHKYKTDPLKQDTDGDGLNDGEEVLKYHTDPLNVDTDGDGLTDGDEVLKYHTDPVKFDTDGDGLSDGEEVRKTMTNPLNPDTDGDGLTDGDEVFRYRTNPLLRDTDNGGVDDGVEVRRGTNPLDPADDMPGGAAVRPPVTGEATRTVEGSLGEIYFPENYVKLTDEAKRELEKISGVLKENPSARVKLVGHADGVGNVDYNKHVAKRRAESVRQFLISKGIDKKRIASMGMGEESPIAPNTSPEGRAKNRRVDIIQVK